MPLEKGIAELVAGFIAAGRPSSREQNIDDRRAGYIASTSLAGEKEIRVKSEDYRAGRDDISRRFAAKRIRFATLYPLLSRRLFC